MESLLFATGYQRAALTTRRPAMGPQAVTDDPDEGFTNSRRRSTGTGLRNREVI